MLCEKCKKNQATVHMKQVVNGQSKELHLCQECAQEAGYLNDMGLMGWGHGGFSNLFDDMFQDMFHISAGPETIGIGHNGSSVRCPSCGMTLDEFKRTGKLGCGQCYEAFAPYLQPALRSIHGSDEHKGKIPQKSGGRMMAHRELETLKRKLAVAIEKEEFEEAARLRDQIRALEKEE